MYHTRWKTLFFPNINGECDVSTGLKIVSDLRNYAEDGQDKVTKLQATVDGIAIPDLNMYRVQSPLFNMAIPKDNPMGTGWDHPDSV